MNTTHINSANVWQVIQTISQHPDMLKSNWCVPPEAGRFLHLITRIQNAKRVVEVGTSIGFSALHLALGVAENAQTASSPVGNAGVISIDASAERIAIARQHFEQAGLSHLVETKEGSALDVLHRHAPEWQQQIDIAFIDARKDEYRQYTEILYHCLRPGGLLIADNTQSHRKEMQAFIDFILMEDRTGPRHWESCEIDTPNGLILARKR